MHQRNRRDAVGYSPIRGRTRRAQGLDEASDFSPRLQLFAPRLTIARMSSSGTDTGAPAIGRAPPLKAFR